MKTLNQILCTSFLLLLAAPAMAFECANAGAAGFAPDDTNDAGATACGSGAEASGGDATAVGDNATAAGDLSIAVGDSASSSGFGSIAVGRTSSASAIRSTSVGFAAITTATASTALGDSARAEGVFSTAIGFLATAPNDNTIVLGRVAGQNGSTGYADVAIGTTNPLAPLHIFRNNSTREFLFLESDQAGGPQDRAMIQLINNGGIRFQFDNPALGTAWRFQAATGNQDNFEVTKVGTGEIEFRVDQDGNAYLAGLLFENSDRNAKTNIETINPDEVLAKLAELPIAEWEYKDTPGQRHVGPMAQDFREAFGLGANDTSLATIDTSGVALASVQALHQQNLALKERNAALEQRLEGLEQQMAALAVLVRGESSQSVKLAME